MQPLQPPAAAAAQQLAHTTQPPHASHDKLQSCRTPPATTSKHICSLCSRQLLPQHNFVHNSQAQPAHAIHNKLQSCRTPATTSKHTCSFSSRQLLPQLSLLLCGLA
jgi:hypothetical protein